MVLELSGRRPARVVHEDVHASEAGQRRVGEAGHRRGIRQIDRDPDDFARPACVRGGYGFRERRLPPRAHQQVRPFRRQFLRHGPAEAL